jgi:hypothetical protein
MKRRRKSAPPPPSDVLFTPKAFVELAQSQGYTVAPEAVVDEEILKTFTENLHEEMRYAIRVALLDADNKNQRSLTSANIDAVKRNMKTFTTK